MRTKIIKIGNSHGIRIPKSLLEETQISGEIEIVTEGNQILIRPIPKPRQEWEQAFEEAHSHDPDKVAEEVDSIENDWDKEEWQW